MATTYYTDIQKLYVAYFSRPADPAGLAYWETVVEASNGNTANVSASFAASAEYTAAYTGMTNAQIISAVYQNLFGRVAETAGVTYWANLLDAKTITMADAVTAIAAGAQGTDSVAYADKVTAASAFTAAVDTPAEMAGYTGAGNTAAKAWLAGVTDATSLTAALDPSALATTVANVVAAGTPFTVAGALASLDTAITAHDAYVHSIDLDKDSTTITTVAQINAAQVTAQTTVANDLITTDTDGDPVTTSHDLFLSTTSQVVRDALVSAQQATNAAALSDAQDTLADDNAAIAKVSGLSAAMTTLTASTTAYNAAVTSETAAQADLAAKEASFPIANSGTLAISATAIVLTDADGAHTLATLNATTGKATLATDVTASDYTGLTDLITSYNAELTAEANVEKSMSTVASSQLAVNLLDVNTDATATITVDDTDYTEAALIAAIAAQINATTAKTVATGATPTVAQIQTELAVLKVTGGDTYTHFVNLVNAETTADDSFNPLVTQQSDDTDSVTAITKQIAKLTKDVTALTTANSHVTTMNGLQATVDADTKILSDKGYAVTTLDAAHTTTELFAGAKSDIYVVADHDATIAAFGLQGTDSLFVGTGYTVVQGAIGATGIKGSDTAMEIFISTNSAGDAQLQIETHAYSSSVTGGVGEIVTITLAGVDASTLHLGTDGIITTGAATTA